MEPFPFKGGFLGLVGIGNQSTDEIDHQVDWAAMSCVFDLGKFMR